MTLLQLIQAVSDYVAGGALLSTSTFPTKAQVTEWLNDGQRFIATILPWEKLPELCRNDNITAVTTPPVIYTEWPDYLELISIQLDLGAGYVNSRILNQKEYWDANKSSFASATSPLACVFEDRLNWYPIVTADNMLVAYKGAPTALAADGDISDISYRLDTALIVYATAAFYKQAEQMDMYAKYMNDFLTILKGA